MTLSRLPTKCKTCRHCGSEFMPARPMAVVCSPLCATRLVKSKKKEEKAQDRAKRERMKSLAQLTREAQIAFNSWVRCRDRLAGYPCVSSGRPLDWSGNSVDAGHLRSVGAAPQLRFCEDNCHAQSKHDNQFLSGNAVEYRMRLIQRIGLERVEALEADNGVRKWTRDELISIKKQYQSKLKELLKEKE